MNVSCRKKYGRKHALSRFKEKPKWDCPRNRGGLDAEAKTAPAFSEYYRQIKKLNSLCISAQ